MEIELGEIILDELLDLGDVELDTVKVTPELEDLEVTPSSVEQVFTHPDSYGYDKVTVEAVSSDDLDITPTTESQQYIGLYGKVDVSAVTSDIDSDIKPENIKSGVDILGVEGTLDELIPEEINITPTTSQQVITPSAGKTGITKATVSAVTSAIDSDIQAGNIKAGVNILGVEGTVVELNGEERTTTPTEQTQVITPSTGKNAITKMTVEPIPSEYIKPTGTINITQNGTTDVKTYEYADVNIPSFWTEPEINDVNFIDYDGTLLYSYSLSEIQAMTELPALPQHPGLICQGWNWTLQELKDLGRDMEVGAMYITDDDKTRAYIELFDENVLGTIRYVQTVADSVVVNWGDGSSDVTSSTVGNVELTHTYANKGKYIITLYSNEIYDVGSNNTGNNYCFMGATNNDNIAWRYSLKKFETGKNVRKIKNCCFREVRTLETASLTEGLDISEGNAFYYNSALRGLVFPRGIADVGAYQPATTNALQFLSFPPQMLSFKVTMGGGNATRRFSLPNITTITAGFNNVGVNVEKLYIPDVQDNNNGSSRGIANLNNLREIRLPNPIAGYPKSEWKIIAASCFENDWCLKKVEIPSVVNEVQSRAFANCYSMEYIDFSKCTQVPTLANSNAFLNCSAEIWIPASLYNTWTTATNWSAVTNTFVAK